MAAGPAGAVQWSNHRGEMVPELGHLYCVEAHKGSVGRGKGPPWSFSVKPGDPNAAGRRT